MSTHVESLRNLYVELAGDETIIEHQQDVGSRDPIEAEDDPSAEVSEYLRQDGLADALEGMEIDS